jgi:hypothetical protein
VKARLPAGGAGREKQADDDRTERHEDRNRPPPVVLTADRLAENGEGGTGDRYAEGYVHEHELPLFRAFRDDGTARSGQEGREEVGARQVP